MPAQQLAELSVDLIMKGWDTVKTQIKGLKDQCESVKAGIKKVELAATVGFALASASLLGFVRAGLQGTQQGEALGFRWTLLSREIAAIFLPVLTQVVKYLDQAIRYFQSLTREQQDNARKWILVGLGALLLVANLGRVAAAVRLVVAALNLMYANPVLAGLALLALALAAVGIQAWRTKEALKEDQAKTKRFQAGDIKKKEWEDTKIPAMMKDADPETRRKIIAQQLLGTTQQIKQLEDQNKKLFGSKQAGRDMLDDETGKNKPLWHVNLKHIANSVAGTVTGDVKERNARMEGLKQQRAALQEQMKAEETGVPFKPKADDEEKKRLHVAPSVTYQWQSFRQVHTDTMAKVMAEEAKRLRPEGEDKTVEEKQLTQLEQIANNTANMKPAVGK